MLFSHGIISLALAGLVSCTPTLTARQDAEDVTPEANAIRNVIVGGGPSGTIALATFDGADFVVTANNTQPGTSASWMLFKEPNLLYAVDENSNNTRLFNVRSNPIPQLQAE